MSVSCSCDYDDEYEWVWYPPEDFSTLQTKRSRKCISCGVRIPVGALQATFERMRCAENDIEDRIYGEGLEVPMADWHMCEECAGLFFSLYELDVCIQLGDGVSMRQNVEQFNSNRSE